MNRCILSNYSEFPTVKQCLFFYIKNISIILNSMKLGQFETISKTGTYYLLARDGEGMGEGNTFT